MKTTKRALAMLLALAMLFSALPGMATAAEPEQSDSNTLRLWYDEPVGTNKWEKRALPIGNGTIGGMTFGEIVKDRLHVNEKTLWTGGPAEGRSSYLGGNRTEEFDPADLEAIRTAMDDKSRDVFGGEGPTEINRMLMDSFFGSTDSEVDSPAIKKDGMGAYQDLGDIYFDFTDSGFTPAAVTGYVRDLDLRTAVSSVEFDWDNVHYQREYFASYPDQVMVSHFTASEAGKLSFTASLSSAAAAMSSRDQRIYAADNVLYMTGSLDDNQEQYALIARIETVGGSVVANANGSVTVSGADEATIYIHADTDYRNEYPVYRDGRTMDDIVADSEAVIDAACAQGYDTVKQRHVEDHDALFSRVELNLGGQCPSIPTDELLTAYRSGDYQLAVEEMAFQMGRYLTIAGSREGDELPTNLCGIWLVGSAGNYWRSDFHFNVNVQMNYWPAYVTNLAECGTVFNDYIESLVVPGRLTADRSNGLATPDFAATPVGEGNGFMINTVNNPFGFTAPVASQEFGWNIGGSSWALQNVYDYYRFTGDTAYLRERIYPMLREMARFWDSYLWYSEYQDRWVVGPSVSAEQGPTSNGTTYDQSLVWELYRMAIEASEILGVDEDLRAGWQEKQAGLKPIQIGEMGQIKEWFEETTFGKAQAGDLPETDIYNWQAGLGGPHRHSSHLIGLYPGTLINKDNKAYMDAAKIALEERGFEATGWSKAWKINMWARTGDAENTYKMVRAMCAADNQGLLDNLLGSHPPFQIDCNYGLTAGIAEMLLQSQLGYADFLPCLPKAWHTGSVQGLVARGNFVIDMAWSGGAADEISVTSRKGGTFTGEYNNLAAYTVLDSNGNAVETQKLSDDRISFATTEGERYTIRFNDSADKLLAQIGLAQAAADGMTDPRLTTAREQLTQAIANAQAVADAADPAAYRAGAEALAAARAQADDAVGFLDEIINAETFLAENQAKIDAWTSVQAAAKAISAEIETSVALLADAETDRAAFTAATISLADKIAALTKQMGSVKITSTVSGGKMTLKSSDAQLDIRYTLDGNTPSLISPVYETPIVLPARTLRVRAAAYAGDVQISASYSFLWLGGNLIPKNTPVEPSAGITYAPRAVDGNVNTYCTITKTAEKPAALTLNLAAPVTFDQIYILGAKVNDGYAKHIAVDAWDAEAGQWVELAADPAFDDGLETEFSVSDTTADRIRLRVPDWQTQAYIKEIQVSYSKGSLVDLTALQALVAEAEALKAGDAYGNADDSDKAVFDAALAVAREAADNLYTDAATADLALYHLLDAMELLGGVTAARALEALCEQLTKANALAETLTAANHAETRQILCDVIDAATAAKEQQQADQYYAHANALRAAMARTERAVVLVEAQAKAQATYDAYKGKAGQWNAARAALETLHTELDHTAAMLADPGAAPTALKAQTELLNQTANTVPALFNSASVKITVKGGKATITASDAQFEIRYTLDGNAPSLISRVYDEPIQLPERDVTVRAAGFVGDMQVTQVVSTAFNGSNLALEKPVSSHWDQWGTYGPELAVDGNANTTWYSQTNLGDPDEGADLVVDLGKPYPVTGVKVFDRMNIIKTFSILVSTESKDGPWTEVYTHADGMPVGVCSFPETEARFVRYMTLTTAPNKPACMNEFEIYAAAGETEPVDFSVLHEALAAADAYRNGAYVNAGDEDKASFDRWYQLAADVAANAASDQETVNAAAAKLRDAMTALSAVLTVTGETGVTVDDEFVNFTVTMSNANRVATATLDIAAPAGAVLEPLNGWFIIGRSEAAGQIHVLMGNNAGMDGAASAEILRVKAPTDGKVGKVAVEVTGAVLSAYVGDNSETYVDAILTDARAEADVDYSIYDVNCDGVVDQLDITRAQRAYGLAEGAEGWIARADVNGDSQVNITDFILIMNNYSR